MNGAAPTSAGASTSDVCVPRLHVVLHQPEIPQNTGNAGRTCLAVGAKLWMVRPLGFQLNEKIAELKGCVPYLRLMSSSVLCTWVYM